MLTKKTLPLWLVTFTIILSSCSSGTDPSTSIVQNSLETPGVIFTETITAEQVLTPTQNIDNSSERSSVPILVFGIDGQVVADLTESVINAAEDFNHYQIAENTIVSVEFDIHIVQFQPNSEISIEDAFLESIRKHKPLMILMAAPVDENLYGEIQNARVPVIYFGFAAPAIEFQTRSRDYLFWLVPTPSEQYAFVLEQLWTNWDQVRPPGNMNEFRIGNLSWESTPDRLEMDPEIIEFLQQNNFVLQLEGEMRNSPHASTTNFILQCIPAGISVLYTDTISYGPMVLLNDIHSLGLNDFFVVSGSVWAYESGNMKYLIAPENVEKFYLPLPSKWWDEVDDPAIQTARQILVHAGRSESDPNLAYLLGLGAMDMIDHVVQEALRDQGGGVISVSDVYSQLAGLKDYPVLGGLFVADYAGGKRSPVMLRLWAVSAGSGWNPIGSFERIPELLKEESQ